MMQTRSFRRRVRGLTFVEMVIALSVFSLMTLAAWPLAENSLRRERELELRESLRTVRRAIDRSYAEREREAPEASPEELYPESLEELVARRYLRSVPVDPMTGLAEWELVLARPEGGVLDVRSRSTARSGGGRPYAEW